MPPNTTWHHTLSSATSQDRLLLHLHLGFQGQALVAIHGAGRGHQGLMPGTLNSQGLQTFHGKSTTLACLTMCALCLADNLYPPKARVAYIQ